MEQTSLSSTHHERKIVRPPSAGHRKTCNKPLHETHSTTCRHGKYSSVVLCCVSRLHTCRHGFGYII